MPVALLTRSAVVAVFLLALLFKGRTDLLTGVIGAAIVAVWTVALIRDNMTRPARTTAPHRAAPPRA